jgi:hypothetical protein
MGIILIASVAEADWTKASIEDIDEIIPNPNKKELNFMAVNKEIQRDLL